MRWLQTLSVPSITVCQCRHRDTGHYTQAHLSRRAKWQLSVWCVCVCVFGDIWSFSFHNIWRWQKTEHETRHQTHTRAHRWDKTEAFHFKDGSDGKWDGVRQSGKWHWSDSSVLLIKKHVIEREGKGEWVKQMVVFISMQNSRKKGGLLFCSVSLHPDSKTNLSLGCGDPGCYLWELERQCVSPAPGSEWLITFLWYMLQMPLSRSGKCDSRDLMALKGSESDSRISCTPSCLSEMDLWEGRDTRKRRKNDTEIRKPRIKGDDPNVLSQRNSSLEKTKGFRLAAGTGLPVVWLAPSV